MVKQLPGKPVYSQTPQPALASHRAAALDSLPTSRGMLQGIVVGRTFAEPYNPAALPPRSEVPPPYIYMNSLHMFGRTSPIPTPLWAGFEIFLSQ